jgi:hypothetical protein
MVEDGPELWHACMASRGFAVAMYLQPLVDQATLWCSDGPDRVREHPGSRPQLNRRWQSQPRQPPRSRGMLDSMRDGNLQG